MKKEYRLPNNEKMLNKAFTLIELLGVLILLAIIALITIPIIDNSIKTSRQRALENTIASIEDAAYQYSVQNNLGYSINKQALYLTELQNKGFLDSEIINPVTNEVLSGCVWYYWDAEHNQYEFEYDMECIYTDTEPTVNITYNDSLVNDNGWAKENIPITLVGNGEIKYCINTTECEPNEVVTNGANTKFIVNEGTSYVCAIASNSLGSSQVLCESFNLDKTAPTVGSANFTGTMGSNNWYTSDLAVNIVDGSDDLSGHDSTTSNIASLTSNTVGTVVTITTTDLAGNTSTRNYTIKIDKNTPSLAAKSGLVRIREGTSNVVSNYFNVMYSVSGGSMICTPTNTSGLELGERTLSCTATGGNGLTSTATKVVTIVPNTNFLADTSGANAPVLLENMIPIVYENGNWVYSDGTQLDWYSYDEKAWANAVILNNGVTKSVGDTISEDEIALWYVWIPRYKYILFNPNYNILVEQVIDIKFESGTETTGIVSCTDTLNQIEGVSETCTNASWGSSYTHPAFTFGDEELTGFWVGKFEVSTTNNTCNNNLSEENCNVVSTVTIKPNVSSWQYANIATYFTSIQNIKTEYGISSGDSHMIKNMEWGAVAYLKQSKYGLGVTDIGINNNNTNITGCGATADSSYSGWCNAYNTDEGMLASTTGNIYGVYDLSGNSREYVMANMVAYESAELFPVLSGFETAPEDKYYDKYTYLYANNAYTNLSRAKLGDAIKEPVLNKGSSTGNWYSDYAMFVGSDYFWLLRGGNYYDGGNAGVFASSLMNGEAINDTSTRAILTP